MDLQFDLSGVYVRLRGLDDSLADRFAERWGPYAAHDRGNAHLDVVVTTLDADMEDVGFGVDWSRSGTPGGKMRFAMHEGEIEIDTDTRARAGLRRGDVGRRFGGLVSLLCAALASTLPSRGGAILHGAGVVIDDVGFLLIGPEGSGKSTWLALARDAGARPLSDDLVVVDTARDRLEVLQSPFRDETASPSPSRPGRWPSPPP